MIHHRFVNLTKGAGDTRNAPFNYSGENLIIRSATPITFIQSSTFMAARLRDYPPASDKILPDFSSLLHPICSSYRFLITWGTVPSFPPVVFCASRDFRGCWNPRGVVTRTFPYY